MPRRWQDQPAIESESRAARRAQEYGRLVSWLSASSVGVRVADMHRDYVCSHFSNRRVIPLGLKIPEALNLAQLKGALRTAKGQRGSLSPWSNSALRARAFRALASRLDGLAGHGRFAAPQKPGRVLFIRLCASVA
jgi:hypothetical protein